MTLLGRLSNGWRRKPAPDDGLRIVRKGDRRDRNRRLTSSRSFVRIIGDADGDARDLAPSLRTRAASVRGSLIGWPARTPVPASKRGTKCGTDAQGIRKSA